MSEYNDPNQESPYAAQTATKGQTQAAFDPSQVAYSTNPNYEGTPTEYYDKSGNLIGYLGYGGIKPTSGMNFVNPDGTPNTTPIGIHSLFQTTDENGNLLFNPAAETQAGEAPVYSTQDQGAGRVMQQLAGQIKMNAPSPSLLQDPLFRNFGLSALAMAGGAALAPELGAAGAGAEAFPVTGGSLIPATELGAAGALPAAGAAGAAGAGSLTEGITPAMVAASEAGLPATMADIGGLASAGGAGGLTAAQALQYAKMGLSLAGLGSQLAGSGGKASGSGSGGSGSGGSNSYQNVYTNQQPTTQSMTSSNPTSDSGGLLKFANLPIENVPLAQINEAPQMYAKANQSQMHMAEGGHLSRMTASRPEFSHINPQLLNILARKSQPFQDGDKMHIPEFITGATGHYVKGAGDGQSDDIPAMLADGEYVIDAETVAQLGNGSSDAGAKALDKMRESIRAQKRSAPINKIPPKAKSPLEYLAGSKRK